MILCIYFQTVISVVSLLNKNGVMNGALIWQCVICCRSQWSSLVSKYQKAHPRVKRRIVVIFLYFCGPSLTSYGRWKRRRHDKMVLRIFSTAQKDRRTLRVVSQYTSEADLFDLLRLNLASRFRLTLPIPYVQAAILLNLLNPYIRSYYRTPWYCDWIWKNPTFCRFHQNWDLIFALFSIYNAWWSMSIYNCTVSELYSTL